MLSQLPIDFSKNKKSDIDNQIARLGMIAELDAVSLYEQLAATTANIKLKKVLLDIAKEEKTHVGEFQAMLMQKDKEYVQELKKGEKEVKEIA